MSAGSSTILPVLPLAVCLVGAQRSPASRTDAAPNNYYDSTPRTRNLLYHVSKYPLNQGIGNASVSQHRPGNLRPQQPTPENPVASTPASQEPAYPLPSTAPAAMRLAPLNATHAPIPHCTST